MYRIIILAFFILGQLVFQDSLAQKTFSIGVGINSSLSIQPEDEKPYIGQAVPPWLISPNIVIKVKKNELNIGPDFFLTSYSMLSTKYYFILSGGHLEYKYHFLNSRKINCFLSSALLYNQFLNGSPITGYDANPSLGSHSAYLKTVTLGSALGGGLNLNLFSRLNLFTGISAGITYSKFVVVANYSYRRYVNQTKFNLIGRVGLGLTVDIYRPSEKSEPR